MGQSFQHFEQRLLNTTADLLNRRAEIQMLRDRYKRQSVQARPQCPKAIYSTDRPGFIVSISSAC